MYIVQLTWQILVCGDFVFLEPFILKTSKYAYKMMKCMYNISNHEMFETNVYELPLF